MELRKHTFTAFLAGLTAFGATVLGGLTANAEQLSPEADIQAAIDAAASGATIELGEGLFEISATLEVTNGVTLKGQGWEKTVVKPASGNNIRLVTLDGGARLEGVTLTGGKSNGAGGGAHVLDGTISWCCISNNTCNAANQDGGGVSFVDGKGQIDHSVIAKNSVGTACYGAGIGARKDGGTALTGPVLIDSCLIYGNTIGYGSGGGVGLKNTGNDNPVTIRNCTVVGNKDTVYSGGLYKEGSGKLIAINTIVVGNLKGSAEANVRNLDASSKNCFFGLSTEVGSFANSLSGDPKFKADGSYHLDEGSPAIAAGDAYTGLGTDLDGRVFANPPALGCYEFVPPNTVKAPAFIPESGTEFYPTIGISLTCMTEGASIYYTTDGTDPDDQTGTLFADAITLGATTTVKARAYLAGRDPSPVSSATYTLVDPIPPTFGEVTIAPSGTKARFAGAIASFGNNGATACDVYLALNGGAVEKMASGVTTSFNFGVRGLELDTEYAYTLSISNNAAYPMGAATSGTFTTLSENLPVAPTGNDDTESLQAELLEATAGDIIELGAGTFILSGTLVLDKDITFKGAGAGLNEDATILDFQSSCRGVLISAAGAVLEGVTVDSGKVSDNGGGVYMTAGTVRDCCITNCVADGQGHSGGGVYMTGGTVVGSEIVGCLFNGLYGHGNALYMNGGVVTNCDIHANNGGYNNNGYGDAVVYLQNGTLAASAIHDNNKDSVPGVHQVNGTMVNCLVYNNVGKNSYGAAGIYKDNNGYTYNCTVYNCVLNGDTTGMSGFSQTKGTTKNCIVWASHPASSSSGSVLVTGGTFQNNVTELAAPMTTDTKTGNPAFVGVETNDFRVTRESSAFRTGIPLEEVPVDIAGVARDAERPCIGAYEFNDTNAVFAVSILVGSATFGLGDTPVAEALVESAPDPDNVTCIWYLDDVQQPGNASTVTLQDVGLGSHALRVSVTSGGQVIECVVEDAFSVLPTEVYVDVNGGNVFPYATAEDAATSLKDAFDALWKSTSTTGVVHVAAGTYELTAALALKQPVRIIGAGRDRTHVTQGVGFAGAVFTLDDDAAYVADLAIDGFSGNIDTKGLLIQKGLVERVRITGIRAAGGAAGDGVYGVGVNMSGGILADAEIDNCYGSCFYLRGVGAYLTGGMVSNTVIRNCSGKGGYVGGSYGLGAHLNQGGSKMINCQIINNGSLTNAMNDSGVRMEGGATLLRNCLVAGNLSTEGVSGVNLLGGTVENCTIGGNEAAGMAQTRQVFARGGTVMRNTAIWSSVDALADLEADATATISHCRFKEAAADDANGNISVDPCFKNPQIGNFHLLANSPLIKGGELLPWMAGATDLDGNPRLLRGEISIGCYVFRSSGTILLMR